MEKIKEILEKLISTSSTKEKQAFLNQHKDNEQLFTLLNLHLNPYIQFYVAKLPTEFHYTSGYTLHGKTNYDKFVFLCHALSDRIISGHQALDTVYRFLQACNDVEKWVFETILLKKSLNLGVSTVNKVRPKFIPEFDCMLADANQPKLDEITYPLIAQPKLDGFRAIYIPKLKCFMGRNGKAVRNEQLLTYFKDLIDVNKDCVLDGELYSHALEFNQIASILGSEDKPIPSSIHYCVYDLMTTKEWEDQKCNTAYKDRLEDINIKIKEEWNLPNVKAIESLKVEFEGDIKTFYDSCLEKGYEGLMLKSLFGLYQWKRVSVKSQIMMKMKPHDNYDGKIIGYEEGKGQHSGMLGALVVTVDKIKNPVKVGSGFTEELRKDLWKDPEKLKGDWILLKGFEITEGNESLRFPVFLSFRDNKD